MSRLHANETGRALDAYHEEVTRWRHLRKMLLLPATYQPAEIYLLAGSRTADDGPLQLRINGQHQLEIPPTDGGRLTWHTITCDAAWLQAGENFFELSATTDNMTGWAVAIEPGHTAPASWVSDDAGRNWRNQRQGYLNAVRGEYLLRVRLEQGHDPVLPPPAYTEPATARLAALRAQLPADLAASETLTTARNLATWISNQWTHTGPHGILYTPWDAGTILDWGRNRIGHAGRVARAMCVHFGVTFVTCGQALGLVTRAVAVTNCVTGMAGHFVAEFWCVEHGKWVMVDANCDAVAMRDEVPMSVTEVQAVGSELKQYLVYGPGLKRQQQAPHMVTFGLENLERGVCFGYRANWPRTDFLSHPEATPPGHGAIAYCETDFVWESRARDNGFGMFKYFAEPEWFDQPPPAS